MASYKATSSLYKATKTFLSTQFNIKFSKFSSFNPSTTHYIHRSRRESFSLNLEMNSLIKVLISLSLLLLAGEVNEVEGSNKHHHLNSLSSKKLFVFGDSFVDTGNIRKPHAVSWKFPYGITFPNKPVGRFSDGRVSTDFLAKLMGIKSPIPYFWRDHVSKERLQYGMNFAYGGTGVFDTMVPYPNMTTQIDFFQKLLGNIYSPSDLISSVVLVSVAGNDYSNYLSLNGSLNTITTFIKQVVDQTEVNLRRIHALGAKKIAIPSLQPLGCFPLFSQASSFKHCNEILNTLVVYHNSLLQQIVTKLNKETKKSTFVIIDLFNAFLTIIKNHGANSGSIKFETPLKWCCEVECGEVDDKGVKKYKLCDDPKSSLFWDGLHPTQEGWRSVYSLLGKNITASLLKP